jgi:hypothetical protein
MEKNIKSDIEQAVADTCGWDELSIQHIEKFGKELSIKTDKGEIFVSARKFFEQYEFRARVFEELGVILAPVKPKKYMDWLKVWSETIMRDLKIEDAELGDSVERHIVEFLEQTDETDIRYLSLGRPVVMNERDVAFRSGDIMGMLKKDGITITTDQLYFVLRKMKCTNTRVDRNTVRVWVWKRPKEE